MEYTTLGSSGMSISRIGLGTMNLGYERDGWRLDETHSRRLIEHALDRGITYFDTANSYRNGASESILGDVLSEYDRDPLVIATKVYKQTAEGNPNSQGLSRKAIEQELTNSLERLGVDTIDLYQVHRWDHSTPIEETLRALDDAVRRNQVRYLGASQMWAYQFAKALHTSERLGCERFVTKLSHYNPVYREEEREVIPLCGDEGVAFIPWSPLARGYLARPHDEFAATGRGALEADTREDRHAIYRRGGGEEINRRIEELATEYGVTMAQLTIAWHLHTESVTAPLIGVSSIEQLDLAVEALDISLSTSDREYIEEPYEPVPISGHE
jgi:aryl-alcohol dehydrogenase-like predicted oxidoreductase